MTQVLCRPLRKDFRLRQGPVYKAHVCDRVREEEAAAPPRPQTATDGRFLPASAYDVTPPHSRPSKHLARFLSAFGRKRTHLSSSTAVAADATSGHPAMAARKAAESFSKLLMEEVPRWGAMKQTGVTLRYMMEFGSRPTEKNLLISAQFLQRELPIRISRRVLELETLPCGLSEKSAVLKIRDSNDELAFTQMIKMIRVRHTNVVPAMALGVQHVKKDLGPKSTPTEWDDIQALLDRFYMSRIGIRMLIGQHVALHDPDPQPGCVGQIHCKMSPMEVAEFASQDARAICYREYGSAPDVKLYGDPNFTFPYVPSHLHLMVFELVKNSLRAVQERYMDSEKDPPPVKIIVADGIEDVTIKISDEGGGIPRSGLPKVFTYLYSTAENPLNELIADGASDGVTMAGYGYGLPISRLHARYFGGDLQILSMEGYGTDAYLHLSRLGDSQEPLP